jgi:CDP-diacylglycerol---serine O-phosphatidyltransferase
MLVNLNRGLKPRNKQVMKKNIPNYITILNLTAGFGAIVALFSGYIVTAAWLIIIAMLFDFLDGLAARLLNAISETGKHLDSLADIVSFSVVPGLILYFLKLNAQTGISWSSPPLQGSVPALQTLLFPLLIPIFGAIRLARFNTSGSSDSFIGLPVPAAALAIIAPIISATYASKQVLPHSLFHRPVLLSLLAW